MLPLLILVVPPTAIGGGYVSWTAGQKLILATASGGSSSSLPDDAPPNTLASNVAGLAALAGTYGIAEYFMGQSESSAAGATQGSSSSGSGDISKSGTSSITGTATGKGPSVAGGGGGKFVQPKSVGDLLSRIGPPVLMRLGAASLAFFCAGAVQTYVASRSLAKEERQTKQK